jgi:EmrB/QacA subfamily drug resistance transporter
MLWAFAITSIALFMTTLDNLVVTTALPVIRHDLHASLSGLEWMVNAYTLTFAVLLLTGAALGDRFGRRRLFGIGLAIFTGGSALAALAGSANELIAARAIQGLGGAIVLPLTLTILSAAVPPNRRGVALGAWGGIGGLAVALGPLVGGAIVQGISWQWIFWLNVPFGLVLIPLALRQLEETHGSNGRLDLPGLALSAAGLLAVVWGLVRGNDAGWTSIEVVSALLAGAVVLALFVLWELRATAPMLPMRFFRNRTFTAANVASLFMFVGMFGSIFLLAQYFQTVQGASPLQSGLRILPWTAMPILIAPIAGLLSDRIGGRPIMATGLALQATGLVWIGAILTTTLPYSSIVIPFALSGIGMAMYFAPVANVVLSSVKPDEEGQASGANNAIRELGGVFGVAVLAAVFSHYGGYQTQDSFVQGVTPALYLGAAIVAIGAGAALFIPRRRKASAEAPQPVSARHSTRRVPLVVGVGVISVIVASTTASAATTPSTRHGAVEPVLVMPALTGPYPVGTRSIELVDRSRREPGTTGGKPRSFVIQLWYPRAAGKGRREPYMPQKVASFIAASGGLPASIFTRVKLAAISDAAPLRRAGGWPVVLFSTGYGVERQLYTGLVQDLASHGYVVAAIDHPHDANLVSFPDGHTVSIGKVGEDKNAISDALTVRIADTRYVLGALTRLNRGSRKDAFSGMFNLDHVGMFGHSLGGATAAATMLADRMIDAGLDMDGFLFGKVALTGLKKPFMLFAAEPGFRRQPNLAQFWGHLKGPRYAVDFAGAAHFAFTDLVFLVPQLTGTNEAAAQARIRPLVGTVNPTVAYAAERAYVLAYFDRALKGKGTIPTRINSFPGMRATGLSPRTSK